MTTMTATEATLFNISQRAKVITRKYQLCVSRICSLDNKLETFVFKKNDKSGDFYKVTMTTCSCKSFEYHMTCKHIQGMPALISEAVSKFTTIGEPEIVRHLEEMERDFTMANDFEANAEASRYAEYAY